MRWLQLSPVVLKGHPWAWFGLWSHIIQPRGFLIVLSLEIWWWGSVGSITCHGSRSCPATNPDASSSTAKFLDLWELHRLNCTAPHVGSGQHLGLVHGQTWHMVPDLVHMCNWTWHGGPDLPRLSTWCRCWIWPMDCLYSTHLAHTLKRLSTIGLGYSTSWNQQSAVPHHYLGLVPLQFVTLGPLCEERTLEYLLCQARL